MSNHGSREVTPEDRAIAVRRMLINSTSPLRITDGMRRALQRRPLRRDLWVPRSTRSERFLRSRWRSGSFRGVRRER